MKIAKRFYRRTLLVLAITALTACATHNEYEGLSAHEVRVLKAQEAAQRRAAIIGAAEAQALSRAQALYPVQSAQAAKKHFVKQWKGYGSTVSIDKLDLVRIDGNPAYVVEKNAKATVYQAGIQKAIIYTNGRVAYLENDIFKGYMK